MMRTYTYARTSRNGTDSIPVRFDRHLNACHYGDIDPKCNACKEMLGQMTYQERAILLEVEEI